MKRTVIYISVAAAALFAAGTAAAQDGGINRQVEVVREYVPDVETARKIDYPPNMVDTVSLKPDISYSVTPTPWVGKFEAQPVNPIRISTAQFRPERPFFVRLGAGAPFQTLADVYATATTANDMALGAYFNHYGRWTKLENDAGDKEKATASRNLVGAFLEKDFGRRALSVNIYDEYRFYKAFGRFTGASSATRPASNARLAYNDIAVRAAFGDDFMNLSRFNFRAGVSASMFADKNKNGQNDLGAFFDMGFKMLKNDFIIRTSIRTATGAGDFSGYSDTRFSVSPSYDLSAGKFDMKLGLDLTYNNSIGNVDFHIFPNVRMIYTGLAAFIPYAEVYGSLEDGSYKALSRANPYIIANPYAAWKGAYLPNPSRYGVKGGIYGSLFQVVSYNVYLEYDKWRDYNYFANYSDYNMGNSSYFLPMSCSDVSVFTFGAALDATIVKGFSAEAAIRFNAVSDKFKAGQLAYNNTAATISESGEIGVGIPVMEIDFGLKYNYREKFYVRAGIEVAGKRKYSEMELYQASGPVETLDVRVATVPASANLKLELEYSINNRLNIFLLGDNLLNQRIYQFNHYPQLGANVMGGIKLTF